MVDFEKELRPFWNENKGLMREAWGLASDIKSAVQNLGIETADEIKKIGVVAATLTEFTKNDKGESDGRHKIWDLKLFLQHKQYYNAHDTVQDILKGKDPDELKNKIKDFNLDKIAEQYQGATSTSVYINKIESLFRTFTDSLDLISEGFITPDKRSSGSDLTVKQILENHPAQILKALGEEHVSINDDTKSKTENYKENIKEYLEKFKTLDVEKLMPSKGWANEK